MPSPQRRRVSRLLLIAPLAAVLSLSLSGCLSAAIEADAERHPRPTAAQTDPAPQPSEDPQADPTPTEDPAPRPDPSEDPAPQPDPTEAPAPAADRPSKRALADGLAKIWTGPTVPEEQRDQLGSLITDEANLCMAQKLLDTEMSAPSLNLLAKGIDIVVNTDDQAILADMLETGLLECVTGA